MGCDIHATLERRWPSGWEHVGEPIFQDWDGNPTSIPCDFRNYDAFAILADVRNGRGFAGYPTGTSWQPIAQPRGVPSDASATYQEKVDHWDVDGHSHSWLTLTELVESEWEAQRATHFGTFDEAEYLHYRATGERRSYSAGVFGGHVIVLTPEEYDALDGHRDPDAHYYINTSWEWTALEAAAPLHKTVESMLAYARKEGVAADDLRLCFFFDN